MNLTLTPYVVRMAGCTAPPPDMIDAARKSLSPRGFTDLMNQTGGSAPTPDQLCAAVELDRAPQLAVC